MPTLQFIRADKVVRVPAPDTSVSVQEIYDQCQDFLDEPANMDIQAFIFAGGKADLGGGELSGITVTLVNDWRLEFEARGGPDTVACVVSGGNFVAVNAFGNNPIKPSAFTQVQIRQSQAPTILGQEVLQTDVTLIKKLLLNRLELSVAGTGNHVLYDDDDSSILLSFTVTDVNGDPITLPEGVPARRTRGQ